MDTLGSALGKAGDVGFDIAGVPGASASGGNVAPSARAGLSSGGIAERIAQGAGADAQRADQIGGGIQDLVAGFNAFSQIPSLNLERRRARVGERLALAQGAQEFLDEERRLGQSLARSLVASGAGGFTTSGALSTIGDEIAQVRANQRIARASASLQAEPFRRLRGEIGQQRTKTATVGGAKTTQGVLKLIAGGL